MAESIKISGPKKKIRSFLLIIFKLGPPGHLQLDAYKIEQRIKLKTDFMVLLKKGCYEKKYDKMKGLFFFDLFIYIFIFNYHS